VNDLKRIVVACGVRKQWCVTTTTSQTLTKSPCRYEERVLILSRSKEFADCPTVSVSSHIDNAERTRQSDRDTGVLG
jgi:hypothetical protein